MGRSPPGESGEWSCRILTDLESVAGTRDAWERLHGQALSPCPFVAPYWLLAWWRAFGGPGQDLRVATVWRGDTLTALLPTRIGREGKIGRHRRVLRQWEDPHSNRAFPLLHRAHAPEAARHLVRCLIQDPSMKWDVARLRLMPTGHPATNALLDALERAGPRLGVAPTIESPYRALPSSADGLHSTLSRSFRKTLRRKTGTAEREGLTVEFRTDSDALPEVFALSRKTWQHAGGTGISSTPALEAFYSGIVEGAERAGQLEIALLRDRGGTLIAFELNLGDRSTTYNLKMGFDPEHGSVSPGLVLREAVLRRAIERGAAEFDFLGTAEPYKMHWTDTVRPHCTITVVRRGLAPHLEWWATSVAKPWLLSHAPWAMRLKRRVQERLRGS